MLILEKPYFMSDPSWYVYDTEKGCYVLTEKAPKEAIESYKNFYSRGCVLVSEENKKKEN